MGKNDQYQFKLINYTKKVYDFLKSKNKDEKSIDIVEENILSFIMAKHNEPNTSLNSIELDGELYLHIDNTLIIDNIKFYNKSKETTKNIIKKLVELGFIKYKIINGNSRYIALTKSFKDHLENVEGHYMRPARFLMEFGLDYWELIQNDYKPHLDNFYDLVSIWEDKEDIKGKKYNVNRLYSELNAYLNKCLENDRVGNGLPRG